MVADFTVADSTVDTGADIGGVRGGRGGVWGQRYTTVRMLLTTMDIRIIMDIHTMHTRQHPRTWALLLHQHLQPNAMRRWLTRMEG